MRRVASLPIMGIRLTLFMHDNLLLATHNKEKEKFYFIII